VILWDSEMNAPSTEKSSPLCAYLHSAVVCLPHRGYFDQSHFVKDFQTFTGCTPTAYLALRRRFRADHPGNALDVGPLPAD
jgi:hypothetical protein